MAEARLTKIYEGATTDTELHVEFTGLAQSVNISVSGGELLSSEIYGRAADLVLSEGTKYITITGVPLSESSIVTTWSVARDGEVDVEQNPLITNDTMASALANHVKKYLRMRNTYDASYRGNPELETGDIIGIQTRYTQELDALILIDQITFNGALHGTLKVKGLVTTGSDVDTQTGKEIIADVPTQIGFLIYTGEEQTPLWNYYDPEELEIGGDISGTESGEYATTFTPQEGYEWFDGTTAPKTVSWYIAKQFIKAPTVTGEFTYNGNEQSPKIDGFDSTKMTMTGTTSATDAGEYTITITPKGDYQWET